MSPEATYPPGHEIIIRVPKGGSSCASCKFLGDDEKTCKSKYYIKSHGSNRLLEGVPADSQCSDFYSPKSLMLRR